MAAPSIKAKSEVSFLLLFKIAAQILLHWCKGNHGQILQNCGFPRVGGICCLLDNRVFPMNMHLFEYYHFNMDNKLAVDR